MNLFTSDLHLGHNSIIKHRDEFSSQEEHDSLILDNIAKLKKREILYVLGDFIFDSDSYDYYIQQMNKMSCRIKVIMGNHDSLKLYSESRFEIQLPLYSYKDFWLSHCPIHPKELRNRKGCIHGHLHKQSLGDNRYFNVNIDVNNYQFVDFEKIKERF